MRIFGHRGAAGHEPENTLRSFRRALDMGVTWLEFDVQLCADGAIAVIHDETMERTTNRKGLVADLIAVELAATDAGQGEPIPTLQQVLALVQGRAALNVELKGKGSAEPTVAILLAEIAAGRYQSSEFLLSSFEQELLSAARKASSELAIGYLIPENTAGEAELAFASAIQAVSVNCAVAQATPEWVQLCHSRGLLVYVYTVNDIATLNRLTLAGVDGVFSDYPDRMLELR